MRWLYALIVACLGFMPVDLMFGQCGLAIEPVADVHWYRADGWQVPGLNDAKAIVKVNLNKKRQTMDLAGWNQCLLDSTQG